MRRKIARGRASTSAPSGRRPRRSSALERLGGGEQQRLGDAHGLAVDRARRSDAPPRRASAATTFDRASSICSGSPPAPARPAPGRPRAARRPRPGAARAALPHHLEGRREGGGEHGRAHGGLDHVARRGSRRGTIQSLQMADQALQRLAGLDQRPDLALVQGDPGIELLLALAGIGGEQVVEGRLPGGFLADLAPAPARRGRTRRGRGGRARRASWPPRGSPRGGAGAGRARWRGRTALGSSPFGGSGRSRRDFR